MSLCNQRFILLEEKKVIRFSKTTANLVSGHSCPRLCSISIHLLYESYAAAQASLLILTVAFSMYTGFYFTLTPTFRIPPPHLPFPQLLCCRLTALWTLPHSWHVSILVHHFDDLRSQYQYRWIVSKRTRWIVSTLTKIISRRQKIGRKKGSTIAIADCGASSDVRTQELEGLANDLEKNFFWEDLR